MSSHTDSQLQPALNPGDSLGYFEVKQPLAAGGMAVVWKGYDKLLDRHVAIKQIADTQVTDEAVREKFRQEADLQKKVSANSKNLVQVYDFVEDPRGLFIVMEYVDGSSLDRTLAKMGGPLPAKQALGIIHQIAMGLAAIHKTGIIHRDLKPSNVLLPREGGVKICDFGLATAQAEQDLMHLGTARYMAPELFTQTNADGRADLYSLGMIGYEMLAGREAFEEAFKTVLRDQRNQSLRWMKWHTNQRLTAPSLKKLNPDLPDEVVELVERLMAKDPAQRIDSAPTLIEVLKRTFSGESPRPLPAADDAGTGPAATADPTAPLPKRSKIPLILAAVLGVQILGVGAYFGWQKYQENQKLQAVRNQAMEQMQAARNLVTEQKDYRQAGKMFKQLAERWPDDPQIGPPAKARMYVCLAYLKMEQGEQVTRDMDFAQATRIYTEAEQALNAAEDTGGIHPDTVAKIREEVNNRRSFTVVAQDVENTIQQIDFSEARHTIRLFREKSKLSPLEDELLNKLAARIEDQANRAELDKIVARARKLQDEGKFQEARQLIVDAQKKFSDSTLRDFVQELTLQIQYDSAISAGQRLERQGRLTEAIDEYRRADQLRPAEDLKRKMVELRSKHLYSEAYRAEQAGDLSKARDLALQSDNLNRNKPAQELIDRIGKAADKQSLVQLGDRLMAEQKFLEAAQAYKRAVDLDASDNAVKANMDRAYLRHYAQLAEAAISRWQRTLDERALDQAQDNLAKARQYGDTDRKVAQALATLGHAQTYQSYVARGDEARKRSDLGTAINNFIRAKKHAQEHGLGDRAFDSAEQRQTDAQYDSWIAQARAAIEAREFRQARAALKAAVKAIGRNTEETLALDNEIKRLDPDGE